MISDSQALFVGSANPFNLKTDPDKNGRLASLLHHAALSGDWNERVP